MSSGSPVKWCREPTLTEILADPIVQAIMAADGVDPLSDIHASAEFRAHLACVQTKRALELAASRG